MWLHQDTYFLFCQKTLWLYSNYPEVQEIRNIKLSKLWNKYLEDIAFQELFTLIMKAIISSKEFSKKYEFKLITCSPNFLRLNGLQERGYRWWKNHLRKPKNQEMILNLIFTVIGTFLQNGKSPAQLFMGHS